VTELPLTIARKSPSKLSLALLPKTEARADTCDIEELDPSKLDNHVTQNNGSAQKKSQRAVMHIPLMSK